MAKGYVIGRLTVLDPEGYKAYAAAASEAIKAHGGRPIVRGGRSEILEGEGRTRNVVIEFDSYDKAKAYYHSPEYQAALKKRLGISVGDLVVVEGVE
jgi:uncharacterized protein (DUF1330 family)